MWRARTRIDAARDETAHRAHRPPRLPASNAAASDHRCLSTTVKQRRRLPNSKPAQQPTKLPSRWQAAPPISGPVRFPAVPRPVQRVHEAAQSRPAREPLRRFCAEIPPEQAKIVGFHRDRPHPAAPRRATPPANRRPASAHRASFGRWAKPDERKRPRCLLTSRHEHRPRYPQAMMPHATSTSLPRRSTPTTTPSIIMVCCFRSTRMGSKSAFSGNSHTIVPSCR